MAKVLNGDVQAGDRIAYPTRQGSSMDTLIAVVLEVAERKVWKFSGGTKAVPVLKVEVVQSSAYKLGMEPYRTTIGVLDRVIKLPQPLGDRGTFLGRRVKVTLYQAEGEPAEVTTGKLLGFGQDGGFEILEDDGMVHYCWPMLHVELSEDQ